MFFRFLYLTLIVFSYSAIADGEICMIESDAYLYNCVQKADKISNLNCKKTLGDEFFAYHPDDNCTLKLSFEFLGKEFTGTEATNVEASCLRFEVGQKNNCSLWDYQAASRYCGSNYGDQYLPHHVDDKCSVELADKEFGYQSSIHLNADLQEKLDEANAILTMIDREEFQTLFKGMVSTTPVVDNEFYSDVMKGLLSKLRVINSVLEKRSHFKIKFEEKDEEIIQFIGSIIEYQKFVARIHKVYAYVAHRNHDELFSYKFSNLDFLNLRLGREFAQEVLSRVNYKTRTVSDKTLEFFEFETNKQIYEYAAISEPKNETDYAKLVTFLGIRENLVNIWAIDRVSKEDLLNSYQRSCGEFLSFSEGGRLSQISSIKESVEFDIFYNKYVPKLPQMAKLIGEVKLLDSSFIKTLRSIYKQHKSLRVIVHQYVGDNPSKQRLTQHFEEDIIVLEEAEKQEWERFSMTGFKSIIYPGDDILNRNTVVSSIVNASYDFKVEEIIGSFLGQYPWISKQEQDSISVYIEKHFEGKESLFKQIVSNKLKIELRDYKSKNDFVENNLEAKIINTLEVAKQYLVPANASIKLDTGISAKMRPTSYEEMILFFKNQTSKKYHDVKYTLLHNEKLSKELNRFFNSVAEKFNKKYLVKGNGGNVQLTGDPATRSKDLWGMLIESARSIYVKNNFELGGLAAVPNAVKLARDRQNLSRSPYMTQVDEGGKVITVHINELMEMFQKDLKINIPYKKYEMRLDYLIGLRPLFELGDRNNSDQITDGSFGRPFSYISQKGEIIYKNLSTDIDQQSLEDLYLQTLDLTKLEIGENIKVNNEMLNKAKDHLAKDYEGWFGITGLIRKIKFRAKGYSDSAADNARRKEAMDLKKEDEIKKSLKTTKQLFARVFEIFGLPLIGIHNSKGFDNFNISVDGQKALVKNSLSKAYGLSPLLRNEITINEKVDKWIIMHRYAEVKKVKAYDQKKRSLLRQIGLHAYNPETKKFDELKARQLILKTINNAKESIKGKIDVFCKANYKNYENDDSFKNAFHASSYLRTSLRSDVGTTPSNAKNIRGFDKNVRENIRSHGEVFHEEYLEPGIMILGGLSLLAIGIMFTAFTFGTAAPPLLASATAIASTAITNLAFNTVFVSMIFMTTGFKMNTHLFEVPEQLKFQKSLAQSQIGLGKVADYDHIKKVQDENSMSAMITVGMLPIDLFFGYTIAAQLKSAVGLTGVKAYKNLTGVILKKKTIHSSPSFRELRKDYDFISAVYMKGKHFKKGIKSKLPKYQELTTDMIKIGALRAGLSRMLKGLKVETNPWVILEDVQSYSDDFFDRFTKYKIYIGGEAKTSRELMLNSGLGFKETMEFGRGNTGIFFRLNSEIRAIKNGNYLSLRQNYGAVIDQLKTLQGSLLKAKYERLEIIIQKISDYKKIGHSNVDDFIKIFTDDELFLIGEIAKKATGPLKSWKKTFKLHEKLKASLRPMTFLYGHHQGTEFAQGIKYQTTYTTELEDITNYYESMVKLHGIKSEEINYLRRDFEEGISTFFYLDKNGKRIYN